MDYQLTQTGEQTQNLLDKVPTIETNLNAEILRSTNKDEELETAIGNEKTRAEGAEGALETAIGNEKTRAEGAELALAGDIEDNATAIGNEKTRAEGAEGTLQENIEAEATARENADDALQDGIDGINGKIPNAASSSNQLADKAFVNSSIATNTADFKGTYNSLEQLEQVTANANDYGFVVSVDSAGNTVYNRYKYVAGTGWMFEYALNNSSFTAAQWAAIQSGITSLLVAKLAGLPTVSELTAQLNQIIASVTAEKTRAENAEDALSASIAANTIAIGAEKTRAEGAEAVLREDIADNALAIAAEKTRAEGAEGTLQTAVNNEKTRAEGAELTLQQNINAEATLRDNADDTLQANIDSINAKIPSAASSSNQLADKAFVNSSISTNTAEFKGTYNSLAELQAVTGANANDYGFVIATDAAGNTVYNRYKYVEGTGWVFEYALNNSSFTSEQWAAIQSGITALLVSKLSGLPDIDGLNAMFAAITSLIPSAATSSNKLVDYAQMVAALATKQNTLTFDNAPTAGSDNPVKSQGILAAINAAIAPLATQADLNTLAGRVTTAEGRITTAESNITSLDGRVSTAEDDIEALRALYNALLQSAPQIIQPSDTWPVANPSATVIYRVIDRVNTPPQYYSDYMWNGTAFVLMATYNNAIDDVPTIGSNNLVKSGGIYDFLIGYLDGLDIITGESFVRQEEVGYFTADGVVNHNFTNFHCITTNRIPCKKGDVFFYKGFGAYGAYSVIFRNGDTIIGNGQYNSKTSYAKVIVPDGTTSAQFSSFDSVENALSFDLISADNVQRRIENVEKVIGNFTQKAITAKGSGYITNAGAIAPSDAHSYSNAIAVSKGDIIEVTGYSVNIVSVACYCDGNVSAASIKTAVLGDSSKEKYIFVSDRDGYITLSWYNNYGISCRIAHDKNLVTEVEMEDVLHGVMYSKNLFNPEDGEQGYIADATGAFVPFANCLTSGFIPAEENTVYTLTRKSGDHAGYGLVCILDDNTNAKALALDGTEYGYWVTATLNCQFRTPARTKYIRFSVYFNETNAELQQEYIDSAQLELGVVRTTVTPYNPVLSVDDSNINGYLRNIMSAMLLRGKTISFDGDSLCEANSDGRIGWAGRVGSLLGMNWKNNGVSGSPIVTAQNSILDRIVNRAQIYDYTVIEISTVNNSGAALGSLSADYKPEGSSSDYDTTTIYGACEYLARYCQIHLKKFGFIIPYMIGNGMTESQNTSIPNAIVDVCKKWGVPYLDLRVKAGFNLISEDVRERFGVNLGGGNYDNCHCNSLAYEYMTNTIANFVISL